MWVTLGVAALALAAYAAYRHWKKNRARSLPPVTRYVCNQCGERDCHCQKQH